MASKITIKRSQTAAAPAGLSYGEMAFIQGSGLTANQLYMGISGGSPVWVGAQIGTTGTWTDNSAQTSLATQYAIEQRITSKISAQTVGVSSFNGLTGAVTGVSSFNGLTGAVSGVTTSVANTFTQLNTFSAGISTAGGTFGTPTQLVGTNITGIATAFTASNVTTNANLTGAITSSGNGTTLGSFNSAQLATALTDETGTGVAVFDTNPNFTTSLTTNSVTLALFNNVYPTTLNGFGAATTMTLGATSGNAVIRNPILTLGNSNTSGSITTGNGNLIFVPGGSTINNGDIASLTITNTESVGQVQIEGGDLFLGNKSDGTTTTPVNIVFEGTTADAFETTLTVTDPTADRTITLPDATGTVALTQTSVASVVAGTGISVSGATGAVTITNTGVQTFNGLTGAVTGVTVGGANTFTQLNTFSAGISASSGVTFSKDITVNSMTVGRGGASNINSVAFGYNALGANTDGSANLAIGYNALGANTDGEENVAIGQGTIQNSSSASYNIAIGSLALGLGNIGSYNIAIGRSALGAAGNTGTFNTGIGYQSLQANTSGTNNTGIGYQSLFNDTTGLDNTGIGTNTLRALTTGSNNTGVGSSAFRSLTTASQMTALGNNAGRYRGTGTDTNTTGTGGIYIGYQARGSTLAQTNEIVIGVNALGLGSNTAVIGATLQSAATIYGVLNLPSGLSASGATFSGNISASNIVSSFNGATGDIIVAGLDFVLFNLGII